MLYGTREGEHFVDRRFELDRKTTGFSAIYWTTDSRDLSINFGLRLGEPVSDEAAKNIIAAKLFRVGSAETNRVISYFTNIALSGGWFVALPFDEIVDATKGQISRQDLEMAINEGFIQKISYPGVKTDLAELSPKFSPLY